VLAISLVLLMTLVAGMNKYVSSANLMNALLGSSGLRSPAMKVCAAGLIPEIYMIVVVIVLVCEISLLNIILCQ